MKNTPVSIGVVITTYNSPDWLVRVLEGYECQTDHDFRVLIADDGSNLTTKDVIETFQARSNLTIEHFWHEDEGFRKTIILNKVISQTRCDYLIFTDGDCIPRADFVEVHRAKAETGYFLSGGYIKLTMSVSEKISTSDIQNQLIFDKNTLIQMGQPNSFKLNKLLKSVWIVGALNKLTPTKASWNGMNSSGWRSDILSVNGFDERMQYGGLDRELGERLLNFGIKSKQIRYSAVCLHLDHPRGYANKKTWQKNAAIRDAVRRDSLIWTDYGIVKKDVEKP